MDQSSPIGLFDSGLGGLSVWRELIQCLPHENTLYFADSANCPYGPRPAEEVRAISIAITHFLREQHCKLIIVACNTASAVALKTLRARFKIPFVGLEPAIKPAILASQTGHIGVLATAGTIQGDLFQETMQRYAHKTTVHIQVGTGLVEQVEKGHLDSADTEVLLRQYLEPMLAHQVDQIALGCTHYPLLMPLIQKILQDRARAIDPAQAVVRQVQRLLQQHHLQNGTKAIPHHRFYTTGQSDILHYFASQFGRHPFEIIPLRWQQYRSKKAQGDNQRLLSYHLAPI